ncbi:hypothetical protein [Halomonas sp. PR-M31]|uniref:hypothetical protein n=1 Tax=Halomonas sp. PR-M31 TaxID=1471202 RepID=UPI000A786961|nr:hypothetical protein [Halomonas sp. PR-M31]
MNLIIVATSLGFGMIPIAAPSFYEHFPTWFETIFHSGISSAAIMAILLNLLFNHMSFGNTDQSSVFVAGTDRILYRSEVEALNEGDHFVDGRLFDAEGVEVPIIEKDGTVTTDNPASDKPAG